MILGPLESSVLGLLSLHSGWTAELLAQEIERPTSQVHKIILRLQDKGLIGENWQPTKRGRD